MLIEYLENLLIRKAGNREGTLPNREDKDSQILSL